MGLPAGARGPGSGAIVTKHGAARAGHAAGVWNVAEEQAVVE